MIVLSKPDRVPHSIQIRNSLQNDIANNIPVPGQKIPSEDELAARFGGNRMCRRACKGK
jgi:DNA-binding GntR family transcriptional regulator